ncbi:hypothetical protein [Ruminococcus sp.]|uniref:hypothetical protein n=1 Tax=Ruminococcus sp. TaxID=41978 RepID=UPI0025F3F8FB|nr:hypothetical protein [Ruminococcus sp.]MCR4637869.1 hypothetical protein [Ruminococcus sp.]
MRNKGLPSEKEWDNIIDEAFSSTRKHDFSVRYELQRVNIQRGFTMKKETNYIKRRYIGMVAAAAAVVIGAPVSVYAISRTFPASAPMAEADNNESEEVTQTVTTPEKLSEAPDETAGVLTLEKNGKYQYILRFTPTDEEANDENKYDIDYTWLPDGAYDKSMRIVKNAFGTAPGGTFDSCYYRVSATTPMIEKVGGIVQLDDVSNDEKTAYIFQRQENAYLGLEDTKSFGRLAWIHFKGTNFIAELFFTGDISDDDVKSIIDGMKLANSGEQTAGIRFQREKTSGTSIAEAATSSKSADDFNIVSVGDTVYDEDAFGNNVEITINDAWIQDNFDDIYTDGCGMPADYSGYLSEDGKIDETYQYGTIGDGIDTLDEITETIVVQKKIIVLSLTYKNVGSEDIYDDSENRKDSYCIHPNLLKAPEWEYNWRVKSQKEGSCLLNHDQIASEDYLSLETDNKGSKNSINIPAGGETHVKISLIANADDLDDLYVDFTGHALNHSYSKNSVKYPLLPVKSIK